MKVLQFAFGSDSGNPYLPHNHIKNCVVYTGHMTTIPRRAGWILRTGENSTSPSGICA